MESTNLLSEKTSEIDENLRGHRELVLVYIGSPSCGFCHEPAYKILLKQAKTRLAEKAVENGMQFRTMGVSKDWSVSEGVQFLADVGEWDEISVGNNWQNSAVLEHMWEAGAKAAVPQVFVLERVMKLVGGRWAVWDKLYYVHLLGRPPLQHWLDSGMPLVGGKDA